MKATRSHGTWATALFLLGLCALSPSKARAQSTPPTSPPSAPPSVEPTAAAKAEARERFDRGIKLFNDGENAGALAEFQRAYALVPNMLLLYNIGLVYAAMGRAVDAVDALDRVLAEPGPVTGDTLARARQTRTEQAQRIAEVSLRTSVPAVIDVDGVRVGESPLSAPLRVTGGVHVIGASAVGYAPLKKEITIAGGDRRDVTFELVSLQSKMADVVLKTHLPHADVVVDDKPVGTTPLVKALRLPLGSHAIELRREGYVPARRNIVLVEEVAAEVTLEPDEDPAAVAQKGGMLALDVTEPQSTITIDGKPRGEYAGALRLPSGVHALIVSHAGFEPFTTDVSVDAGRTLTLPVALVPTFEARTAYVSHAKSWRLFGIIGASTGVALAGTGTVMLLANAGPASRANDAYAAASNDVNLGKTGASPDPACNTKANGGNAAACNATLAAASSRRDDASRIDVIGWVGVGVGAAATLVGAWVLVTGDDPHRYDGAAPSARVKPTLLPFASTSSNGGVVGVAGSF